MTVRPVSVDPVEAVELAELLEFVVGWLDHDGGCLAGSFRRFVGSDSYPIEELRADLKRFALLLGADEESLVGREGR